MRITTFLLWLTGLELVEMEEDEQTREEVMEEECVKGKE
jgi:hypothetical protein